MKSKIERRENLACVSLALLEHDSRNSSSLLMFANWRIGDEADLLTYMGFNAARRRLWNAAFTVVSTPPSVPKRTSHPSLSRWRFFA
jgi:hypothetical protein